MPAGQPCPPQMRNQFLVIFISSCIGVIFAVSAWDINYWPTDVEDQYMPAAQELSSARHVSDMHRMMDATRVRWLHGKEALIVLGAVFEQFLHDSQTLRPWILMFLLAVLLSSFLIYSLAERYWGPPIALGCCFAFVFSFWPYLYILFAKHQPLGLFFFLISVFFLKPADDGRFFFRLFFSGLALGLSFFSSSVSPLYAPYWLAAFVYLIAQDDRPSSNFRVVLGKTIGGGLLSLLGIAAVVVFCNYPDIGKNLQSLLEYSNISAGYNHFYYNQPFLQQWFPGQMVRTVRGGWPWVLKYFLTIMPVIFPLYLVSVVYLLGRMAKPSLSVGQRLAGPGIILLSLAPVLMAETKHVAQYGGNYFPALVGILFLLGFSGHTFLKSPFYQGLSALPKKFLRVTVGGLLILHAVVNLYIFSTDIYPCRMATTFMSRDLAQLGAKRIYTYEHHPLRFYLVDQLSPALKKILQLNFIDALSQAKEGYVIIPPVTGDQIYLAMTSHYKDFDQDLQLNGLIQSGRLAQYAVGSYKTLASSRIWALEEEIFAYRQLMLHHFCEKDSIRDHAWILDAKKIQSDISKLQISEDDFFLWRNGIKNIGTRHRAHIFEGELKRVDRPVMIDKLAVRLYRVGQPKDALVAYLYKLDREQPVWVPVNEDFASLPLAPGHTTDKKEGQTASFEFLHPVPLNPGLYLLMIYRLGEPDDQNFYRIYRR